MSESSSNTRVEKKISISTLSLDMDYRLFQYNVILQIDDRQGCRFERSQLLGGVP
jgi:hypothetical protein